MLGAAGGVGLAAVELGRLLGARVIAAASSSEKLAACAEQGADACLDYRREPFRERLKELTGGRGVDLVFDPVGGPLSEPAFRSLAWGGRHLVVGFAAGEIPRLPLNLPLLKGASLVGVFYGEHQRREPERWREQTPARLFAWLAEGRIRPRVAARFPLAEGGRAIRALMDRQVIGKVLVEPGR
ncbi:MAG: hypothetical protein KatS3mg124_0164 [Porticoccaceae bacterium]|nr:MAG: hypothetical protein KatS3mg124_0164 [Porticoccaceae bacterium]